MFGLNPWALLIGVLAFGAATGGAYLYGDHVGATGERVKWQAKESAELSAANAKIIDLTEKARAQESLHAVELASISAKYQEDLQHEKADKDRTIAGIRAGTIRLRDPDAIGSHTCGGDASAVTAAAQRHNGETGTELQAKDSGVLSVAASEFIVGIGEEADEIVRQLTACQAVIMQDRKQAERPGR